MEKEKRDFQTTLISILLIIFVSGISCRNDPFQQKTKIESIIFDKERVEVKINEETTVKVTAKPDEAKRNEKIEYTSVNEGVIEIREPTNDGFIVKGLRGGSTVIVARSELVTNYFEVVVHNDSIAVHYVNVGNPVIEINEGERKTTQVNLYGGNVLDNNDFQWRPENGKNNIRLDVTANIGVIEGLERGYQKIYVSHPKADFESEILVFVRGVNEPIKYISSASNVVLVPNDDQYHNFQVLLVNGTQEDVISFEYEIVEGNDVIEIISNETVCNIMGLKSGTAVIRVKHPAAVMDFYVRIIVYDVNVPFIMLEQTFLFLNIGESKNIAGQVENAKNPVMANDQFSFEKIESRDNVVEVIQNNNYFFIRANQSGNARVIVSNEQAELPREILVVVRDEEIYRDSYYITTAQNVITTQVGADEIQLTMQLINGVTADANSFEWTVDDGTLITVESVHGTVRGNRAVINSAFNAAALITPKKAGTAKITLAHPKAESSVSVLVKVYPKGTFDGVPVILSSRDEEGNTGLFHLSNGQEKTIILDTVSGDRSDVGSLDWEIEDNFLAAVNTGAHGLVNVVSGKNADGLTKLIVSGNNLAHRHEALVAVNMPGASIIYVDNIYQIIAEQQVVNVEVKDSNNEYADSNEFTVSVEKPELLYAVMVKNRLMLQGKQRGETKVIIDHPYAVNDITLNVRVEPAFINIDKPYYIGGPEIAGVVRGYPKDIAVSLVPPVESEEGRLQWSIDDPSVAVVMANGKTAIVTGRESNRQTKLRIRHREDKAENEKMILLYVVENESDLFKVALGLESENYLMTAGENRLITLITNASDTQKTGLKWTVKQDDGRVIDDNYENGVIRIDHNYSSAMIWAKAAGHAEIIVTHEDNILPLTIYVSVIDALTGEKSIKGPAVIELLTGVGQIVGLSTLNLNQDDKENIVWAMESGSQGLANLEGNGDSAYILGLKEGVGYLTVNQKNIGYNHRVTVLCADTPERLASMYILAVTESYHVMKVGDEKRIQLEFGSNGFPEDKKSGLVWKADANGSVSVAGQGEKATIVARAMGDAVVRVSDPSGTALNSPFEITISVRSNVGSYVFGDYEKIVGIVRGNSRQISVKLFEEAKEISTGYSLIDYEILDKVNNEDVEAKKNSAIIGVNQANNIFDLSVKNIGESKLIISHKQVNDPARVLVYTANTQEELDAYYPIIADKTHYLLQVNETAAVTLTTIAEKDGMNLNDVQWGLENAGVVSLTNNGKKEGIIRGLSAGSSVININYRGVTVERIFITVTENDAVDMTKYIMTENIIGLLRGTSRQTKIHSNLTASEIGALQWESSDEDMILVSGSGDTVTISAKDISGNTNEAYVTVSYGSWLKRHILVYVCEDEEYVNDYKAMNMDEQYYRMGRNETIMLPVFFAPVRSDIPTIWVDKYDNKVVKFTGNENGAKIEVTSLNEGVAVLEAVNTGLSNSSRVLRIYIEVSNRYNEAARAIRTSFLTTLKTIHLLNPTDPNAEINLNVTGIGMNSEELNKVNWQIKDGYGHIVRIFPNGQNCTVRHNGIEDTAAITASYLDNIVEFKVIVSTRELAGIPYIAGDDTIRVGINGIASARYEIAEIMSYDASQFVFTKAQNGGIIDLSFAGGTLEVTGLAAGQALIKAKYGNGEIVPYEKDILVVVTTTPDGLIYLTTRDNFNVIKQGEYKTLSVDMVGFDNPGNAFYNWSIAAEDSEFVSLDINATGRQAQVKGEKTGTAMITVSNRLSNYDLVMYVRVVDADLPTVYMTTAQNVVSVTNGNTSLVEMELVGGNALQTEAFDFESLDKNIFTVTQAGNRALIQGINVGNGRLRITNIHALNSTMTLFVAVQPVQQDNGIYIVSDYTIVDIKPNETMNLSVRLVGAKPGDNSLFSWNIGIQNSIVKNSQGKTLDVIQLPSSSGPNNAIKGINEGEATIIVTNMACPGYELHMRIYVLETRAIQFSVRSQVMVQGETMYIPLTALTGTIVNYSSNNPDVVWVSSSTGTGALSTNQLCYVEARSPGIAVITARNSSNTASDEIIIEVRSRVINNIGYIQTPDIIYNMTDWQSIMNRLVLVGTPVGNKLNGDPFIDIDDSDIFWKVDEDAGQEVIGLGLNTAVDLGGRRTEEWGKAVSVYSLRPGVGKVLVSHRGFFSNGISLQKTEPMTDYYKTIYINITPYNANFRIEPQFINAQTNQVVSVEAIIANIIDKDYNKVEWTLSDYNTAKFVYYEDNPPMEKDVSAFPYNGESKVYVKIIGEDSFQIRATYNEQTTLESVVYVEKEKYLELLLEEGFIQLLPNEDAYIPYKVQPVDTNVSYWIDNRRFSDVVENREISFFRNNLDYTGPDSRYKTIDWNIIPSDATHIIHIKAADIDGFNRLELRSHNNTITKLVTLETNHRYMFVLDNKVAIRGHPGTFESITYKIQPPGDRVTYKGAAGFVFDPNNDIISNNIGINDAEGHQILTFNLLRAGFNEYIFESEYNKQNGIDLKVPVYVYYDTIPLNWKLVSFDPNSNILKSRMDAEQNAIFIANDEVAYLYIVTQADANNIEYPYTNGVMYYDHIELALENNYPEYSVNNSGNGVTVKAVSAKPEIVLQNEPPPSSGTTKTSLLRVDYAGSLKVYYSYFTGGEKPTKFEKVFLLYAEIWN